MTAAGIIVSLIGAWAILLALLGFALWARVTREDRKDPK